MYVGLSAGRRSVGSTSSVNDMQQWPLRTSTANLLTSYGVTDIQCSHSVEEPSFRPRVCCIYKGRPSHDQVGNMAS